MLKFSKTQIDRLGDRLRKGPLSDSDLIILDDYRRSFGGAYEIVVRTIREQLKLEPTGRPAKSTGSIIEKLRRESIRLSQVQDIAGCRVVIGYIHEQEQVVALLRHVFSKVSVVDRRTHPSYGYRAVHVIAEVSEKLIEIQVRSSLQHLWAELSEKISDVLDPTIKYGRGEKKIQKKLITLSEMLEGVEERDIRISSLGRIQRLMATDLLKKRGSLRKIMVDELNRMISEIENLKEQKP